MGGQQSKLNRMAASRLFDKMCIRDSCSGKFRAYLSGNTPVVGVVNGKISTTTAEFDLSADKKEDVTTKLILNDVRTLSEIRNDKKVLEEGKDYTISGDTVSIRKEYLSKQAVGVTKLTFVFDAGKNAVMSITIKEDLDKRQG